MTTSETFPVMWGYGMSFPVTWPPPAASYSPVEAQTYPKVNLYAFYSHFQGTSGQMTSLLGHFRSRDGHLLRVSALSKIKPTENSTYTPTATSSWLPVKWRHFRVTFGNMRSRDVISCHVTATSCELQPCKSSNVPKSRLIGFYTHFQATSGQMTSLPGHFRSREVTWRYFLSLDGHLLRVTACRSSNVPKTRLYAFHSNSRWLPVK